MIIPASAPAIKARTYRTQVANAKKRQRKRAKREAEQARAAKKEAALSVKPSVQSTRETATKPSIPVARRSATPNSVQGASGTASKAPVPGARGTATASRLIAHVGATNLPMIAAKHAALCGVARPVSKAIASDCVAVDDLRNAIAADLRRDFAENPTRLGVQVARLKIVSGEAAVIAIDDVKKGAKLCKKSSASGISTIRTCAVSLESSDIPGIALDLVTMRWGEDTSHSNFPGRRRARIRDDFERSSTKWFEPDDPSAIDTALGIMFPKSFTRLPPNDPEIGNFAEFKSGPGQRAFITLMCRAQMQLSRMLVPHGAGKAIVRRALTTVDAALALRCEAAPEILSFEEIVHFLFGELRRQRMDEISVPIIKPR